MNVLEIVDITNLDVSERNRLDKQMMYCVAVIQILIFGAAQRNKLEPLTAPELLEELEDWSAVINAEPEILKVLEASVGTQLPEMEP